MIATVRIAPVEQWCEFMRREIAPEYRLSGMAIEIKTDSMGVAICGGRHWELSEKSSRGMDAAAGHEHMPTHNLICEHLLEMD